jgi:hypothetical protein
VSRDRAASSAPRSFLVTFQKLAVHKGVCKDENEMKKKGKVMATGGMKWLKRVTARRAAQLAVRFCRCPRCRR